MKETTSFLGDIDYRLLIPTVVSAIAALFSILTFRRNRKLENENYLFRSKIEHYPIILTEMNKILNLLNRNLIQLENHFNDKQPLTEDEIDDLADIVDEAFDSLDVVIFSNSLLLPATITLKLEEIVVIGYNLELPHILNDYDKNHVSHFKSALDLLFDKANEINNLTREDLNIEALNKSLYRRIKT